MKIHDITWTNAPNGNTLKLLTPEGVKYGKFPFKPFLYINDEDYDEVKLLEDDLDIEKYNSSYWKISFKTPSKLRNFRGKLRDELIPSHEDDILYGRRVLISEDSNIERPNNILFWDIEVDPRGEFPNPKEAEKRILSIAAVSENGKSYFFSKENEKELIKEFLEVAKKHYCIMGWNSAFFDYPYLKNRCQKLNIYFDWFELIHIDAMLIYHNLLEIESPNYKLDTVARNELEEEKGKAYDLETEMEIEKLWEFFKHDKEKLKEYNMRDAELLQLLEERIGLADVIFEIASSSHTRVKDLTYRKEIEGREIVDFSMSSVVESIILQLADEDNRVIETPRDVVDTGGPKGGAVFETKPGRYDNVIVFDFAGMYPSIIRSLNIGLTTYHHDDSGDIKTPFGSFDKEPESLFKKGIEYLLNLRMKYKKKKKELTRGSKEWRRAFGKDAAFKKYLNSFYGVTSSIYSRLYQKEIAEVITYVGRDLLTKTKEFCEKKGHTVVTGDTDSVLVALESEEDVIQKAKDVQKYLNEKLKKYIELVYDGDPDPIEIDMDEVYAPFLITEAKKKYAGICIYDSGPCYYYTKKGFESVRGDWPAASRKFQDEVIKKILKEADVAKYVKETKTKLFEGELDDEIVQRVTMKKEPDDYKSVPPHVRAAEKMRDDGEEVRAGDKIPYIKYGNKPKQVVPALNIDDVDFSIYNYSYIWEKKFKSLLERLGVDELMQTKIGEFEENEKEKNTQKIKA